MRVVVIGATGNVGTSLVRALAAEPAVDSVLGVARRLPDLDVPKTDFATADVAVDDTEPLLRGADAVVHLAWLIQPSRDREALRRTNVDGSARLLDAAARAGVPAVVAASSIGVYSPARDDRPVDESYPRDGVPPSWYSRHKAELERLLDRFEREQPGTRVVRLRPALTFKRESASGQRRQFLGPFVPAALLRPGRLPLVPLPRGLRVQAVHADDVAAAYRLAVVRDEARGAYNVAAEPLLDAPRVARLVGGRLVEVPRRLARAAAHLAWRARLHPTSPDWLDLGLAVPVLDAARIRAELGWSEAHDAESTVLEWLEGLAAGDGAPTPPLEPGRTAGELSTGVGARDRP